jgi:hypothetical protein
VGRCTYLGQDSNDLLSLLIGHVGDVLERVVERRHNKGVIVGERSLGQIEAHASRVYDDESWDVLTGFVDDNCGQRSLQEPEDIALSSKWLAVLAVRLRSAAIQVSQVELGSIGGNLMCYADASGFVEFAERLATLSMVGEGVPVPVQVSSRVAKRRVGGRRR